jgi:putative chitinase
MNPLRKAAFIGQCGHECGNFRMLEEGLSYSAAGLMKTWPKRFDAAKAQACQRNPKLIANTVYANRMGNRDEASGDGYRFRGRGCIQLTGSSSYFHAGKALGVDFWANPDLVATPQYAALTAGWFWDTHKLNQYADAKDYKTLTKKINGGFIGLEDRIKHIDHALLVLAS